jgi:hypothetical protein
MISADRPGSTASTATKCVSFSFPETFDLQEMQSIRMNAVVHVGNLGISRRQRDWEEARLYSSSGELKLCL